MVKPFVNRIRYTPEVASRPERLEKDLANAKKLASILEEDAAKLRVAKVLPAGTVPAAASGSGDTAEKKDGEDTGEKEGQVDTSMVDVDVDGEPEEEPKEKGSDAVDRRIEKVMADLRDQGLVDVNDEKAYEERKVRLSTLVYAKIADALLLDDNCIGFVPRIPSCCV